MKRTDHVEIMLLFVLLSLFIFCVPSETCAQQRYLSELRDLETLKMLNTKPGADRVRTRLKATIAEMMGRGLTRQNARARGASAFSNPLVRVDRQGNIQTYVYVDFFGAAEQVLLESYESGIEIVNEELNIVQAWIPFTRIMEVARLPFVTRVTAPNYAIPWIGSVTTEGDAILRADEVRALGVDGSGVKVGVISNGADSRATAVASGDLPPNITILNPGDGDEGTAMLEIVHDLAPGAQLGFCGVQTSLDMISCVNGLAGSFNADIIVDDLGFPFEPFFADGPIAQTVENVLNVFPNLIYASSAGNSAERHYQGSYVDSNDGRGSHQISLNNNAFEITGSEVLVVLQWSNAFGSSGDDYDLCLTTETPTECAAFNIPQNGDDDPIEWDVFPCPLPGCSLQVRLISGNPQELELYVFFGNLAQEDQEPADSIWGHPAVPGVMASAAIDAGDPGNNTIEPFSSRGPVTILPLAQPPRPKPDLTAIDGVSVTGAGGFPSPFFGTSAAAPHVAGVAALLKGGFSSADDIINALTGSAVDLGPNGFDNTFGAGRIDAFAAVQQFNQPPDGVIDTPAGNQTILKGQSLGFNGTCTDPNGTVNASFLWEFGAGSGVADATVEDPGNVIFDTVGTFQVFFTCMDEFGEPDPSPDSRTIDVQQTTDGIIDSPPDNVSIERGQSVTFNGTVINDNGNPPLTYL
ncbi:MAG: S8 family serine peptidase, partial [Deltaproteobacteria bacterium]|nr:S8 family serine peptidase [Deltaproteobacteria bacterium]